MSYFAEVFYPRDLEAAKQTVLPPDPADPGKFKNETEFLISFIKTRRLIKPGARVLDFGCGMGRVAKALIDAFECRVVGTDISLAMRHFAEEYVASPQFEARETPDDAGAFDLALAVLVLQHAQFPDIEVERLYEALRPGGALLVVNEPKRFVPSGIDGEGFVLWNDDGISIDELLARRFALLERYPYYRRSDTPLSLWRKQ